MPTDYGSLAAHVASALGALKGYGHGETAAAKSLQYVQDELMKLYESAKERPAIKDDMEGELAEGLKELAIRIGKPLIRTSFPGPDAHKLTLDEYAFEIGKCEIGIALGLIETKELESIDSHLPKVRFDAPFAPKEQAPAAGQPDDCRPAFERWVLDRGRSTFGYGINGHYHDSAVQFAWGAWRARPMRESVDAEEYKRMQAEWQCMKSWNAKFIQENVALRLQVSESGDALKRAEWEGYINGITAITNCRPPSSTTHDGANTLNELRAIGDVKIGTANDELAELRRRGSGE